MIMLLGVTAFLVTDFVLDRTGTLPQLHLLSEIAPLVLSAAAIVYLLRGWRGTQRSLAGTVAALEARGRDRDAWRARAQKMLVGLGEEIDSQLREWRLSGAERDVALFLLKGYGHQEIAHLLGKSARTVRQQAASVYQKSGLSGRAEFSAFFLEDLLLPTGDREFPTGDQEVGIQPPVG
jgi:DNA-binding NarL/FixJ family response regulator